MKVLGQTLGKKDLAHVIPRLIIIFIIGQTLPFKYTGHPESVNLFTLMDWEPVGRYLIAITETIAIIFLLTRYYIVGAITTLSIISAANFMHFTRLGINVNNDGGLLFFFSIVVIICSLIVVIHWNRLRTQEGAVNFDFEVKLDEEKELEK